MIDIRCKAYRFLSHTVADISFDFIIAYPMDLSQVVATGSLPIEFRPCSAVEFRLLHFVTFFARSRVPPPKLPTDLLLLLLLPNEMRVLSLVRMIRFHYGVGGWGRAVLQRN